MSESVEVRSCPLARLFCRYILQRRRCKGASIRASEREFGRKAVISNHKNRRSEEKEVLVNQQHEQNNVTRTTVVHL